MSQVWKSKTLASFSPGIPTRNVGSGRIVEFDSDCAGFLGFGPQNDCVCLCGRECLRAKGVLWCDLFAVYSPSMAVQVSAHITGTVWKIEVKVGDSVTSEQSLVILESMKMEMPVEAPQAGRVARIAVSEGQAVEEGDLLLELE